MCVIAERTGILVSAEDDILDVEDEEDDDLDASVETDEGIVADETPSTGEGEAVAESDAEKVSSDCLTIFFYSKMLHVCLLLQTARFLQRGSTWWLAFADVIVCTVQ